MNESMIFDVSTPIGFRVHCTKASWEYISTVKHPILKNRIQDVIDTLQFPLEIRRSTRDSAVLLFYREVEPRFLVVVARQENRDGFLITAYPTDRLKKGEIVWTVSK